jgi:hypothetical protein
VSQTVSKLLLCVALGAAVAGCNANQGGSAAPGSTPAATASPAGQAASRAQSSASPAAAPSSPAVAPDVGVVADCASAEPFTLSREPSSIVLACADDGIRVEDLAWSAWTASGAAGHGTLLENRCVPNCAEGNYAKYPVAVTLSGVTSSAEGPWFKRLTVTWERDRPPNQTPDTFTLESPGSPPMSI